MEVEHIERKSERMLQKLHIIIITCLVLSCVEQFPFIHRNTAFFLQQCFGCYDY